MKRYYNKEKKQWHLEGESLTAWYEGALFSGVPSEEMLTALGYEEWQEPEPTEPTAEELRLARMEEIRQELAATDYIVIKRAEGIDITEYDERYQPNFLEWRAGLRREYNELELEAS